MRVKVWEKGQDMEQNLTYGKYALVLGFPDWTPQEMLDRIRTLNKHYSWMGKSLTVTGVYEYSKSSEVEIIIDIQSENNPFPIAIVYFLLIIATGLVAFFTLKKVYKIVKVPAIPIIGIGVVGLLAVKAFKS